MGQGPFWAEARVSRRIAVPCPNIRHAPSTCGFHLVASPDKRLGLSLQLLRPLTRALLSFIFRPTAHAVGYVMSCAPRASPHLGAGFPRDQSEHAKRAKEGSPRRNRGPQQTRFWFAGVESLGNAAARTSSPRSGRKNTITRACPRSACADGIVRFSRLPPATPSREQRVCRGPRLQSAEETTSDRQN